MLLLYNIALWNGLSKKNLTAILLSKLTSKKIGTKIKEWTKLEINLSELFEPVFTLTIVVGFVQSSGFHCTEQNI